MEMESGVEQKKKGDNAEQVRGAGWYGRDQSFIV